MTDNEILVVCVRDAINELLHRCKDLGLTKPEILQVGDGIKSMVTFKDSVQEASCNRLSSVLDKPGRVLERDIS